ncbi:triose-phosphate isomerase [Neisseria canis]|uniref:Triosephosphate isomerase n=1 Tax=Neisseria canis TaxID=493 RepID=A0A1X3CZJ9_9NEIS|nr:triose-phosphate isomerase [Neisseria canis]OSI13090.1 triose-phosphate isomerase [Neisseria canis]VEF01003.1 triosephosphate isomerase [Neisseria canis]
MWDKKWVIGNWKMNGQLQNNNALVHKLRSLPKMEKVCIGISPPTVYLSQVHNAVNIVLENKIHTCAQDVSRFNGSGAYTGEVSAEMMKDVGVDIVLIGHSERSLYFNEKNDVQRHKIENVLNVGLTPLLCVGESLKEREDGREKEAVAYQLSVFKGLKTKHFAVAYEPVWAIGTGKVATKEQIADMHDFIYNEILSLCGEDANIRILYGGSVNDKNAAEIFTVPHVDGALVGGASLKYESFTAIIQAAQDA